MKRIFKVIIVTLIAITLIFTICGCDKNAQTPNNDSSATENTQKVYMWFTYIGGSGNFDFYKEDSTDVIYIYAYEGHGYGAGAAMSVMLDPETGFPLTYTKWVEKYQ